jgi:fluoride ion exporter CrcB/FEX
MNIEDKQDEIDMLQIDGENEEMRHQKQRQRRGSTSADWSSYLLVATFAYLGVSVRVLLTWLSRATDNPLLDRLGDTFFLPNVFGSFILGLVNGPLFNRIFNSVKPVQTGIASGFCGSCTTFASWHLFGALRLLNGDWSTAVVQSPIIFCTSYMAAAAGRSVGQMSVRTQKEDSKGVANDRKVLLCALTACIMLTIAIWVQIGIEEDIKR